MFSSQARVATPHASLYLKKLCKHFRHKVPAEWDAVRGDVRFPMGTGHFQATAEALLLHARADTAEALATVQWIIDDHLARFSRQENRVPVWRPQAGAEDNTGLSPSAPLP